MAATPVVAAVVLLSAGLASSADGFSWANLGTSGHAGNRLILTPHRGDRLPSRAALIKVHAGKDVDHFRVQLNGEEIGAQFSEPSDRGVRRMTASSAQGLQHGLNHLHARADDRRDSIRFRVRHGGPLGGFGGGSGGGPVQTDRAPAVWIDTMAEQGQDRRPGIQVGVPEADGRFYGAQDGSWAQLVVLDRQTLQPVNGDLANKSYTNCSSADTSPCVNALKTDLNRLNSGQLAIVASQRSPGDQSTYREASPQDLEGALGRIGVSKTYFSDSSLNSPGSISAIGIPGTQPGLGDWRANPYGYSGEMRGWLVRDNKKNYMFTSSDRLSFNTHAPESSDRGAQRCPGGFSTPCTNVIQLGRDTFRSDPFEGGGFQVLVADAVNPRFSASSRTFRTDISDKSRLLDQLRRMRTLIADANSSDQPRLVFIVSLGNPRINYPGGSPDTGVNLALQQLVDQVEQLGGTRNGFYKTLTSGQSYTLVSLANSGGGKGVEAMQPGPFYTNVPLNTVPISGTLAPTGPAGTLEVQGTPRIGSEDTESSDPSLGAQELSLVAFQRPTPWPEQDPSTFPDPADRARKQAAIKWLGNKVVGTPDIRGQYWTYPLAQSGFDRGHWQDVGHAIQDLTYPSDATSDSCPGAPPSQLGFCPNDLQWAQTELAGPKSSQAGGEIGWLINTNDYLGHLAEPFKANTQLTAWADLQKIADGINSKVNVDAGTPVTKVNFTAIFDFARGILEVAPDVGEVIIALNSVYDLVSDITEVEVDHHDTPAGDPFSSKANDLGVDLANRMDAGQEMLNRGLPNVIASDYGKLRVVGACSATVLPDQSQCPYPLSDWQQGQDDQSNARDALINSTRAWAYSQLLPLKYSLFQLPDWWRTSVSDNDDFYRYPCGSDHSACNPFNGEPATAQVAKPIYRNMPTYAHTLKTVPYQYRSKWESSGDTWRIYALGRLDKSNPDGWTMGLPDSSVTNEIFNPRNKNDLTKGPLGLDPETFFDQYFTPVALPHYPTNYYDMGWCQKGNDPCGGQQP